MVGQVVAVVDLPDLQGGNPKRRRPAVIVASLGGGVLLLVAATGQFDPDRLEDDEVRLPHGNSSQPSVAGFSKPTIAKCTWLAIVRPEDCHRYGGTVPAGLIAILSDKVQKMVAVGRAKLTRDDRQPPR